MAQIIWSNPALSDLEEIAEYIALDKISAAEKLVQSVFASVDRLVDHPKSGRYPPEIAGKRYREVLIGPCRVFYRYSNKVVYIVYVMRGERKLREFILEERED